MQHLSEKHLTCVHAAGPSQTWLALKLRMQPRGWAWLQAAAGGAGVAGASAHRARGTPKPEVPVEEARPCLLPAPGPPSSSPAEA